jgi:hypothetical protein
MVFTVSILGTIHTRVKQFLLGNPMDELRRQDTCEVSPS